MFYFSRSKIARGVFIPVLGFDFLVTGGSFLGSENVRQGLLVLSIPYYIAFWFPSWDPWIPGGGSFSQVPRVLSPLRVLSSLSQSAPDAWQSQSASNAWSSWAKSVLDVWPSGGLCHSVSPRSWIHGLWGTAPGATASAASLSFLMPSEIWMV